MASYLQADNLAKSYGPRVLFENLSFNINEGDKIALIAPNGTGKTSLLNILAGKDSSDGDGKISFMKDISVAFLEQENIFPSNKTIFEVVLNGSNKISEIIRNYELAIESTDKTLIQKAIAEMDSAGAWTLEHQVKEILSTLSLHNLERTISQLSGGEIKRVAIAQMLVNKPDFLVMDEPTNHLDLEIIEFLEDYLSRSKCTLFMVTHDRYFLDRVCNKILEMADGTLYTYNGNYSYFLEKREERIQNFKTETERARNLLRTELDWMRRMPCARGTKAKYRVNAFYDLKEKAEKTINDKNVNINVKMSRLGKKIINCKHLSFNYDKWIGLKDFSYNFAPGEKIGIVGRNGVGKTTFLKLLTGQIQASSGELELGETLVTGYYQQKGIEFNPNDTVIDAVREIAEVVTLADGKSVPVSTFLNYFLFPPSTHYTKIEKLSGGEKRRLYLLTILMKNPNFLILDEPTNDLDILTLNVLEEYLSNFSGSLLIVSHDRFFLDKIADHLFIFEGNGVVKDFVGQYSDYRQYIKDKEKQLKASQKQENSNSNDYKSLQESSKQQKKKLSYKEQKELEQLEADIQNLEQEKVTIETELSSGNLPIDELTAKSTRIGEIIDLIDSKSFRWLELSE